jgi:hypothetical protein
MGFGGHLVFVHDELISAEVFFECLRSRFMNDVPVPLFRFRHGDKIFSDHDTADSRNSKKFGSQRRGFIRVFFPSEVRRRTSLQ